MVKGVVVCGGGSWYVVEGVMVCERELGMLIRENGRWESKREYAGRLLLTAMNVLQGLVENRSNSSD